MYTPGVDFIAANVYSLKQLLSDLRLGDAAYGGIEETAVPHVLGDADV